MKYMVIIEKGPKSWGAYVPDLPGCAAAGDSRVEVVRLIKEAMEFHLEGLKADGAPIPQPSSEIEYIDIPPPDKSLQPTVLLALTVEGI